MNLLDQFAEYTRPMLGSEIYKRWAFLTVCAALLERRVWLDRGRLGILFPNMYTLLVGPPATGKSWAAEQSTKLLDDIVYPLNGKPLFVGSTKVTQAALYQELKQAERGIKLANGSTALQAPVFIYASELAVNMTDFGGGTLTNELIDFYDSKAQNAKMVKHTVSGGPLELCNPSITLIGCTAESFLQAAARDKLITSGLASRIVFVVEPNRVVKQRDEILPDYAMRKAIQIGFLRLYTMQGPMYLDPEAKATYNKLANAADEQCFTTHGDFIQNYYGRKPDHICKLAMVRAALDGRYQISPNDLLFGAQTLEEIEPNMSKAFGIRNIAKDEGAIAIVLPLIPFKPGAITRAELFQKLIGGGNFMAFNGDWKALIEGLIFAGVVEKQNLGNDDIYMRLK